MTSALPFKVLLLAASALSPLIAVKVVHGLAPMTMSGYAMFLGGLPLPALTDMLIVRFAASNSALGCGLAATVLILLSVASFANPRKPPTESAHNWQMFLGFIGPFLSLLYVGTALVAALLPLVAHAPISQP